MPNRLTMEHCYSEAQKHNGKCLSRTYLTSKTKYTWECKLGHIFKCTHSNVKKGHWCPTCAGKRNTIQTCQNIAKQNEGKCLSEKYIKSKTKYLWECKKRHQWKATFSNVKSGFWCPNCAGLAKLTLQNCKQIAKQNKGKCLSNKYINNKYKYTWQCKNGHIWQASLSSIKNNNTWCPKCLCKTQTFIYETCERLFPNCKIKYNFKDFNWLKTVPHGKMELDIYIPELKLAIEYDGEQHFRPVTFGNISIKRAKKNLKIQKIKDKIKDQKIKSHPNDVKYFLRFNYKENITEKYVKAQIQLILNPI